LHLSFILFSHFSCGHVYFVVVVFIVRGFLFLLHYVLFWYSFLSFVSFFSLPFIYFLTFVNFLFSDWGVILSALYFIYFYYTIRFYTLLCFTWITSLWICVYLSFFLLYNFAFIFSNVLTPICSLITFIVDECFIVFCFSLVLYLCTSCIFHFNSLFLSS
jgi:hypothetical protein